MCHATTSEQTHRGNAFDALIIAAALPPAAAQRRRATRARDHPGASGDFHAGGRQPDRACLRRTGPSGIHTAKGIHHRSAQTTSVAGMKADCDNINLNRKLSTDFLRDVFRLT